MANDGEIQIIKLNLTRHGTNCYILICRASRQSVIVDAPGDVEEVRKAAEGTSVQAIWLTHNHGDHTGGLDDYRHAFKVPVFIHEADADIVEPPPDALLGDAEDLGVGTLIFQVIHVPGHTPGSACFLFDKHLIGGDTLFPGGPGYTRTPEALAQEIESITRRLLVLPEDTIVHPGHGPGTTIGEAKREYAVFAGRSHRPDLCGDVLWLES